MKLFLAIFKVWTIWHKMFISFNCKTYCNGVLKFDLLNSVPVSSNNHVSKLTNCYCYFVNLSIFDFSFRSWNMRTEGEISISYWYINLFFWNISVFVCFAKPSYFYNYTVITKVYFIWYFFIFRFTSRFIINVMSDFT